MARPPRRRTEAIAWLEKRMANGSGSDMQRLPPIARLAAEAGVAKNTMLAAVQELRERGLLESVPGRGTRHIPGRGADRALATPPGLAAQMEQDIVSGRFTGRSLPSVRQLATRYGVSPGTVRRALGELMEAGYVRRFGRRFQVAPSKEAPPHATIVLLGRGNNHPAMDLARPTLAGVSLHTQDNLRALERYCAEKHVRLEHVPCIFAGRSLQPGSGDNALGYLLEHRAVVGVLVWTMALPREPLRQLLEQLYRVNLPVAFLDELGDFAPPSPPAGFRLGRFRMGCSVTDGEVVGRVLLRKGHRRCAYISDNPLSTWSRNRRRGLERVFSLAGPDTVVREFSSDAAADVATNRTLQRRLDRMIRQLQPDTAGPSSISSATLRGHLTRGASSSALHTAMAPVIRQALRHPELTAWVASTDSVALECLGALREAGVSLPSQRVLVGYDNSPEAVFMRLSSYDFSGPVVVRAMVDFVLGAPQGRRPLQAEDYTVVEGEVVERETT